MGLQALVVTNAATNHTHFWGGKLCLPQRPKVFSLWQLRCLCQAGAWQPKQQHKRLILPKCFSLPLWIFQVAIMLYLQEYHSLNHA